MATESLSGLRKEFETFSDENFRENINYADT